MKITPKFSVILPTYNVEAYITRCIVSLRNQKFNDFEMVFVDDCGDDNSLKIVSNYAEIDERIQIIKNKNNLGTYLSRRAGVEIAKGDYVIFLDPDDELDPKALSQLNNEIENDPDIVFFGTLRSPGKQFWHAPETVPILKAQFSREMSISVITQHNNLNKGTPGKVFKRTTLLKAYNLIGIKSGSRLVFGEDQLLLTGVLLVFKRASSIQDRLYIYHRNITSITIQQDAIIVQRNMKQLRLVLTHLANLKSQDKWDEKIKLTMMDGIRIDLLKLANRSSINNARKIYNLLLIFKTKKSFRNFVKMIIGIFSLGKIVA